MNELFDDPGDRRARRAIGDGRGPAVAGFALFSLLVGAFSAGTLWQGDLPSPALAQETRLARRAAYRANMEAARLLLAAGSIDGARAWLEACEESSRGWEWRHLHAGLTQPAWTTGAGGELQSVALDAAGRRLATSAKGGMVTVIDLDSDEQRRIREGGASAPCVVFTPDGRTVVTAGYPKGIQRWDADSGELKGRLSVEDTWVQAMDLSPDGTRLATVTHREEILLLDLASGRRLGRLAADVDEVTCLRFHPDGRELWWGSKDGRVQRWEPGGGASRLPWVGFRQESQVRSLAFDPSGRWIAIGRGDGSIEIAGARGDASVSWIRGPRREGGERAAVLDVAFHPSSSQLGALCRDGMLGLWDIPSGRPLVSTELDGPFGPGSRLAFHPDGRSIVVAAGHGRVEAWTLPLRSAATFFAFHAEHGPDTTGPVACSPADGSLAVAMRGGVTLLGADSGRERAWLEGTGSEPIEELRFSPDGSRLVALDEEGVLFDWDVAWRALRARVPTRPSPATEAFGPVTFSADGRRAATPGAVNEVQVWEVEGWHRLALLPGGPAQHIAADGESVFVGRSDGSVEQREVATAALLRTLRLHEAAIGSIVAPADGRWLVTSSVEGRAALWDLASGAPLRVFETEDLGGDGDLFFGPAELHAVAVDTRARRLFGGRADGTLVVWDLDGGDLLARLEGHAAGGRVVTRIELDPRRDRVVTGTIGGEVGVWDESAERSLSFRQGLAEGRGLQTVRVLTPHAHRRARSR